ncbi:MAG: hypothetical protein JNK04_14590 [Myxococcales bacterium]|nr:hypothetical protein [Myxococcales bacterium]
MTSLLNAKTTGAFLRYSRPVRAVAVLFLACSSLAAGCADRVALDGGGPAGGGGGPTGGASEGGSWPEPSPCGETPSAPGFEVGTGEECFEALPENPVVPRVGGPQGGFHVWGAFLCADCPYKVRVNVGLKLVGDDAWVGEQSERVIEVRSAQAAGLIALLPGTSENPSSLLPEGSEVRLVIELRTMEGAALQSGERTVTLGDLEFWEH